MSESQPKYNFLMSSKTKNYINKQYGLLLDENINQDQFVKSISNQLNLTTKVCQNKIFSQFKTYEYWDETGTTYECLNYALNHYDIDKSNLTPFDLIDIKNKINTKFNLEVKFSEYLCMVLYSKLCKISRHIKSTQYINDEQIIFDSLDDPNFNQQFLNNISYNPNKKIIFNFNLQNFITNILEIEEKKLILILLSDRYTNQQIIDLKIYSKPTFYRLKKSIQIKWNQYNKER